MTVFTPHIIIYCTIGDWRSRHRSSFISSCREYIQAFNPWNIGRKPRKCLCLHKIQSRIQRINRAWFAISFAQTMQFVASLVLVIQDKYKKQNKSNYCSHINTVGAGAAAAIEIWAGFFVYNKV